MRALVWFRSDLRTADNPALAEATRTADRGVVGVFTLCPGQWREHDWGDVKVEFLLRNLACLVEKLRRLNIPLRLLHVTRFATVPRRLLALAREVRCDALYFNREYEVNEARRDAAVERAFAAAGHAVHAADGTVILPPAAVRTTTGGFYTVFTPYRRAFLGLLGPGVPLPPRPRRQPEPATSGDALPERVAGFDLARGQLVEWPAGEDFALRRLAEFVTRDIADYDRARDFPGTPGTSRLSPYLALGVLAPSRCLAEARAAAAEAAAASAGAATWTTELIWREFYRHVLVGFPRVSMGRAFRPATERLPWRDAPEEFAAWCAGRTGYPIVDAGMRQLAATGWMHNRVRMIVAMFLTKDLFVSWQAGERHFMRHLVDGDLASNNGGWQWSASTGTDAAPYFRIFNPLSQGKKFDPDGAYIRTWVPELADLPASVLHDPTELSADERRRRDYPGPLVDHAAARQRVLAAFQGLPRMGNGKLSR